MCVFDREGDIEVGGGMGLADRGGNTGMADAGGAPMTGGYEMPIGPAESRRRVELP